MKEIFNMKPKTMEISYQEAEKIIRQFGHSVTRKKQGDTFINTVTWSINGKDAIKTIHSNEDVKIIGLAIKKFNSDSVVLTSLSLSTDYNFFHIEQEKDTK